MTFRISLLAISMLGSLLVCGCEPECYPVDPISKVRSDLKERVDDELENADVTDSQRTKIQKLFETTVPVLERLRAETTPRQREILGELKRDAPDRAKLAVMLNANIDAGERYVHFLIDVMLKAHAVLTPEQRKKLASEAAKPSESFEGSWLIDRGVDYFLSHIDATPEQRTLVERIKQHLLKSGRELQRKSDALRAEGAHEFAKDVPDAARMHDTVTRGRAYAREMVFNLSGYYLLLASKLDPRQRALLNAELVRFEPCPATPAKQDIAALGSGA
jgi:Spy/CpxP family protein refolding chaperone